jgi:hypothetical protein
MGIYSSYLNEAVVADSIANFLKRLKNFRVPKELGEHFPSFSKFVAKLNIHESTDFDLLQEYNASESDVATFQNLAASLRDAFGIIIKDIHNLDDILKLGIEKGNSILKKPSTFKDQLKSYRAEFDKYNANFANTVTKQAMNKIQIALINVERFSAKFSMTYGDNAIAAKKKIDNEFEKIYKEILAIGDYWFRESGKGLKDADRIEDALRDEDPDYTRSFFGNIFNVAYKWLSNSCKFALHFIITVRRKLFLEKENDIVHKLVQMFM